MPGMGGRACLDRLLQLRADAKVLISTAYGGHAEEDAMVESGAAGLLSKPYGTSEMLDKIECLLDA